MVFDNVCTQKFTYEVNGPSVVYLGTGDYHDPKYDHLTQGALVSDLRYFSIQESQYSGPPPDKEYCPMYVSVHASAKTEDIWITNTPWIFAVVTAIVFILTVLAFLLYTILVDRRQKIVLKSAVTSNAIVSSLFPEAVKKQLMETQAREQSTDRTSSGETFLNDGTKKGNAFDEKKGSETFAAKKAKQIAELFPETTVMFADIAGFTAWSSTREPSHVFALLETLYGAFDKTAKKLGIFKVETIGDSYVAVCGLPEPNKQHSVKMAKFASSCLNEMSIIVQRLEIHLGPGTGDLALRIGLHSGPTIAGVLRGEKARFQLFGDTVNTAARMESTSFPNKIQVSQKTAEQIIEQGKGHWLVARKDLVNAKGKGLLQTYWMSPRNSKGSVVSSINDLYRDHSSSHDAEDEKTAVSKPFSAAPEISEEKLQRLIDWNVELFEDLLKQLKEKNMHQVGNSRNNTQLKEIILPQGISVRDQAVPTVLIPPAFEASPPSKQIELDPEVREQLRAYITAIAYLYNSTNAFHNFEHASHVIMSTVKLLQRVVTFGVMTDPLVKFSIVFSALIHDLDHAGVSNGQLVKVCTRLLQWS